MKITRKKNKETMTIFFEGDLTIYHVMQSKESLFADHENLPNKIALDLRNVSEIDSAGVQLLLFARIYFAKLQKNLFIAKSNDLVDAVLNKLDVSSQFALES
jgi:anti-sigma B factor antagonist